MVQVQLGERVDELRLDMQGGGEVDHDADLVLLDAAVEQREHSQHPDSSSCCPVSVIVRTNSPEEMGVSSWKSTGSVWPKTVESRARDAAPVGRRQGVVPRGGGDGPGGAGDGLGLGGGALRRPPVTSAIRFPLSCGSDAACGARYRQRPRRT